MSVADSGFSVALRYRVGALAILGAMALVVVPVPGYPQVWESPSLLGALLALPVLWFVPLVAWVAVTGREPPTLFMVPGELWDWLRGTHPQRASPALRARLRRLGFPAGWRTSVGEARRLIGLAEGRQPPTLDQQRALARYRVGHAVMTRVSAERYLEERAREEEWLAAEEWAEGWEEAGVEIALAHAVTHAERAAFDAAWLALSRAGVPYPLPAMLAGWEVVSETARMGLALDMPRLLDDAQRDLAAGGVLRRPLDAAELRAFIPDIVKIRRLAWEDVDEGAALLYVVSRDRPGLLAAPWNRGEYVASFEEFLRGYADEGDVPGGD